MVFCLFNWLSNWSMEIETWFVTIFGFLHGWCSSKFVAMQSSTFLDGEVKVCSESDDCFDGKGNF